MSKSQVVVTQLRSDCSQCGEEVSTWMTSQLLSVSASLSSQPALPEQKPLICMFHHHLQKRVLLLAHSFIHSLTGAVFNFVCPRKNSPPRVYFSTFFNLGPLLLLLFSRPNINHTDLAWTL